MTPDEIAGCARDAILGGMMSDTERSPWPGCWEERTHHDRALIRIAALQTELAAERKRRRIAEAMLLAGYTAAELDAHFAYYKEG